MGLLAGRVPLEVQEPLALVASVPTTQCKYRTTAPSTVQVVVVAAQAAVPATTISRVAVTLRSVQAAVVKALKALPGLVVVRMALMDRLDPPGPTVAVVLARAVLAVPQGTTQ